MNIRDSDHTDSHYCKIHPSGVNWNRSRISGLVVTNDQMIFSCLLQCVACYTWTFVFHLELFY